MYTSEEQLLAGNKGNIAVKKKYAFIFEGEKTEPCYFHHLIHTGDGLKIKNLIDYEVIPRGSLDYQNTDIVKMIDIADGYVQQMINSRFTLFQLITDVINTVYKDTKEIKEKSSREDLQKIRDRLVSYVLKINEGKSKEEKIIFQDKYVLKPNDVIDICRNVLKNSESIGVLKLTDSKFRCSSPNNNIKKNNNKDSLSISQPLKKYVRRISDNFEPHISVKPNQLIKDDIICIVHDRDYSDDYFNDELYLKAEKRIKTINMSYCGRSTADMFRLIITHPKFELWLLLHCSDYDFSEDYKNEPDKYKRFKLYADDLDRQFEDTFGVKVEKAKTITISDFKTFYLPHISDAINRSKDIRYSNDLKKLISEPGTMMGDLMSEILNRN